MYFSDQRLEKLLENENQKKLSEKFTATVSRRDCAHKNGWYDTIYLWIWKRRVFICTDCMNIIKEQK